MSPDPRTRRTLNRAHAVTYIYKTITLWYFTCVVILRTLAKLESASSHRFAMVRALFAQSATRSELGEKYVFARITIRAFRCNYCVWPLRFYSLAHRRPS